MRYKKVPSVTKMLDKELEASLKARRKANKEFLEAIEEISIMPKKNVVLYFNRHRYGISFSIKDCDDALKKQQVKIANPWGKHIFP